jgi:hypothetical protein
LKNGESKNLRTSRTSPAGIARTNAKIVLFSIDLGPDLKQSFPLQSDEKNFLPVFLEKIQFLFNEYFLKF